MIFKAYKIIAHHYLGQGKLKMFFRKSNSICINIGSQLIKCQLWNTSKIIALHQISPNGLFVSLSYLGWPMTPNPI